MCRATDVRHFILGQPQHGAVSQLAQLLKQKFNPLRDIRG